MTNTPIDRASVERLAEYLSPDVKRTLLSLLAALDGAEAAREYQTARLRLTMESMERALDRAEAAEAELERVRAEEREACATVAVVFEEREDREPIDDMAASYSAGRKTAATAIAAAIRARGET